MRVHDLLADISFVSCSKPRLPTVPWCVFIKVIVRPRHLLHFHIGGHRLLPVDLGNEGLHAFCHTLAQLRGHVRDDIDDLFLSLLSLIVCLDHVQDVVVLCLYGGKRNLTNVELLPLNQTSIKLLGEGAALDVDVVSLEWINWKFRCVNELMLFHLSVNSFA